MTAKHSRGTAGDDIREALSARVRVCHRNRNSWAPAATRGEGRAALSPGLAGRGRPVHSWGGSCSFATFFTWNVTRPRPRLPRAGVRSSQARGLHRCTAPTHVSVNGEARSAASICPFSSTWRRGPGRCENYGFPPTPVKTVISKFWTWRIKKKSYILNKQRGNTQRSHLFLLQIVGKENLEALKKFTILWLFLFTLN